jgi:hypothetical protein
MKKILLFLSLFIILGARAQEAKHPVKQHPRIDIQNKIPKSKRTPRVKMEEKIAPKVEADKKKRAAAKKKQKSKARKSN